MWRDEAACVGVDTDVFFPSKEIGGHSPEAFAVCGRCVVLRVCCEYAIDVDMSDGIFGGMTQPQRKQAAAGRPLEDIWTENGVMV